MLMINVIVFIYRNVLVCNFNLVKIIIILIIFDSKLVYWFFNKVIK